MKNLVVSATTIAYFNITQTALEVLFGKVRIRDISFMYDVHYQAQVIGNAFRRSCNNPGMEQSFEFRITFGEGLIEGQSNDPKKPVNIEIDILDPARVSYLAQKFPKSAEITINPRSEDIFGPVLIGTGANDRRSEPYLDETVRGLEFSI